MTKLFKKRTLLTLITLPLLFACTQEKQNQISRGIQKREEDRADAGKPLR